MTSGFDSQTLAEKLNKLNNSQQSIESLSSWCISHRKKARQVVETWEKLFNSSPKEQKVSFLYLANDILQNSRRKGSEFVNEFWKVLPGALKNVYENGEDHGKTVVMRLVGIWDERKVFGSRGRGLKNDILGKESEPPPLLDNNGKSSNSNPIKVVKRDAQTIRLKLAVGGMPEKIATAYQSVLDEHFNEDTALNKCKAAIHLVGKIAKDVDVAFAQGNLQGSPLTNELQEQETILKQCINQLRSVEAIRASLIAHLKEGLQEQESKLEHIHTQIQAAQSETERAGNLRQRVGSAIATTIPSPSPSHNPNQNLTIPTTMSVEATPITEPNPTLQTSNGPQLQPPQPVTSFTTSLTSTDEQHKKAAAAAMAAKLAASTSSAQMLTSVLSSLVAEEAASKNGSLTSVSITGSPPMFPVDKRPKLEKPMQIADLGNSYFGHMQQQLGSVPLSMPPVSVSTMLPPLPQNNHPLPPFPPPPPPLQSLPPPPGQQFIQTSGGMVGVMPYGFPGNPLPPPPPLPSSMGLARPGTLLPPPPPPPLPPLPPPQQQQQQQQQQHQPQQQQQHSSAASGFYQSPGNGFYGQLQSGPPGPRQ